MYPAHLLETLDWHGVDRWPASERRALVDYGKAFLNVLKESDDPHLEEWANAWANFFERQIQQGL